MGLGRIVLMKRLSDSAENILYSSDLFHVHTVELVFPMDRIHGKVDEIRLLSLGKSSCNSAGRSDAKPQMEEAQDRYRILHEYVHASGL